MLKSSASSIRDKNMKNLLKCIIVLAIVMLWFNDSPKADSFLSAGDVAGISVGTATLSFSGYYLRRYDTTRTAKISTTLPMDNAMMKLFGGSYYPGKTNFLDNHFGSAVTPVSGAVILTIANLSHINHQKSKFYFQDLFLYTSGIIATKGVTDLTKGFFTRPRPYIASVPMEMRTSKDFITDRSSFFSGHTSGAFFAVSYLNMRIRSIMRSEMSSQGYRDYRWISPTLLYSWATFVGMSRIHAYKHYFSDILFGAAAGYLMAELFYSFGKSEELNMGNSEVSQMIIQLNFSF